MNRETMRRLALIAFCLAVSFYGSGCQFSKSPESKANLAIQLDQARLENQAQRREIEKLHQQIETLPDLTDHQQEQRIRVESIGTGRYTGGFDENNDGCDDGINIYLLLRDQYGDVIKAAGQVRVELWDLAAPEAQRLWAKWQFNAEELQERWLTGLISRHYKLTLHWPDGKIPHHKNLTLKLTFIEIQTGRSFELQKMVTVSLSPKLSP
jgi:hypothetical protein